MEIRGPVFFLIYVNDLSQYVSDCLLIQYADDTQFVYTGTLGNIEDLLKRSEATLSKLKDYFHLNGLLLNANKAQCMFIGSRGHFTQIPGDGSIKVDGANIVPSTSVKNLGIYFDNYLQFDTHITHICRKSVGTIMYINRIKDDFSKNARITILQSIVLSVINYGIIVMGKYKSDTIKSVQN